MPSLRTLCAMSIALLVCLAGCSGGGGGGGGGAEAVAPPDTGGGDGAGTPDAELVVVRYDHDGDGNPDLMTLDRTETPFTVVEALRGTVDGGSVDATTALRGERMDPALSDALASFLAESHMVASERELDATDSLGNPVTLTVFE